MVALKGLCEHKQPLSKRSVKQKIAAHCLCTYCQSATARDPSEKTYTPHATGGLVVYMYSPAM